tara:strand:+ start:396 stop:506 length:111 start_codon:yes stop_codon:yes gene_type:complete
MKEFWTWIGEFIGCFVLFGTFYFVIWILAILFPGAM